MTISIEAPQILWLLLLNILFLWIPYRFNREKRWFYIAVRLVVFTCLILGFSGIHWHGIADENHTIFLVDDSASVQVYRQAIEDFLNDQAGYASEKDFIEIIVFGEDLGIEVAATNMPLQYDSHVVIDRRGTNIENAFAFALQRFDEEKNKRLVLVSDFKETSGDLVEQLSSESYEHISFKHLALSGARMEDVQLQQVEIPKNLRQGERFPVSISIFSDTATRGTLTVYNDDKIAIQKEIDLKQGIQRYVFEDQLTSAGGHQYVVRIDVSGDQQPENNSWHNIVQVDGPPKVLVIDPKDEGATYEQVLKNQGFQVTRFNKPSVHYSLEALAVYDGLVMINASIEELGNDFLTALDLYTKELGGGLLTIGGSESYAVGGYEDTLLEKLLPVDMALKVEGERYDLAMMVVVDKSGSMAAAEKGPSKMHMAKEAVLRVAETMSIKDQLGLIAFDGSPYEVFPLTEVSEMDIIAPKVAGVKADGGTSILPALEKGLEGLSQTSLKGKHLLLVSDGQGEQRGYEQLVQKYPDITISTIAIGDDADARTMERIATYGGGRFYLVTDYRKIPEIFTKETRLAMDEFIKEGEFIPVRNSLHPVISNVTELPLVYGYVSTTAKPASELILSIDEEPLLATWQYGLGKTMAWTSDVSSWSRNYFAQSQGIQFLTDMTAGVFSTQDFSQVKMNTSVIHNKVYVNGMAPEGQPMTIELLSPDGKPVTLDITQYSDGYFEGEAQLIEEGFVFLKAIESGQQKLLYQVPLAINYSKEYDLFSTHNIMEEYTALLGSLPVMEDASVFTDISRQTSTDKDLGQQLVLFALCLFVVDVACRKLRFDPIQRIINKRQLKQSVQQAKTRATSKPQSIPPVEETQGLEVMKPSDGYLDTGRLLSNKRKRGN